MKKYVESYAREGTRDGADEASREWVRQMGQITPLLTPDLQASVLHGTLLWPGSQVSSIQASLAVSTFSRNPNKDMWSRIVPQEYGFQKFGTLWKYLVDEYLVNATPSLGPVCSAFVGSLTGPPCRREPETKDAAKGGEVQKRRLGGQGIKVGGD